MTLLPMKLYLGTKLIKARPMTRIEYNNYRGWMLPEDECGTDTGFLVEYVSATGDINHPDHEGYISWSPTATFEESYKATDGLSFGLAIDALKMGRKVARAGWNGKGMFLFLVNGSQFTVNRPPLLGIYPEGTEINYQPHIDLRTVDGSISTWSPSCSDALATDWLVLDY